MAIRRAALLTFHRDWEVCRSRISLLRMLNPGVEVHGLFGGEGTDFAEAARHLDREFDTLAPCDVGTTRWRWQHTDLVIRDWYVRYGHVLAIDILHVLQWDLLLFAPLDRLYQHVPLDAMALTGITPLTAIADRWHWTRVEPHRTETPALFALARERWGFAGEPTACVGPGTALPRRFLERYAAEQIPELGHDEVRLPLFAQLFGLRLVDTGFYPEWFNAETERPFNANGAELQLDVVRAELSRTDGRRAFHPCRESFGQDVITALLAHRVDA